MALDLQAAYKNIANLRIGLPITASVTSLATVIPGTLNVTGGVISPVLSLVGTVSPTLTFAGTSAGTLIQLLNSVSTTSGTVSTAAYAAIGVTPGMALEQFALSSHRWWTGSSGTTSGMVGMQLGTAGLVITGSNTPASSTTGSLVVSGGGVLIANTTNASSISGSALHVTGGALVARDLYVGGLLYVPKLPYAYGTVQNGFAAPTNTGIGMPLYTTVGDPTLQAAIGSYYGPGGSLTLGRFVAPYNGTFSFTSYIRTNYQTSSVLEILLYSSKLGYTIQNSGGLTYTTSANATMQMNAGEYIQGNIYSSVNTGGGYWSITDSMFLVQLVARHP